MAALRCPSGMIVRSAYTTKRGVHVRPACVPDKGAPGKTPAWRKVLPKPKKGSLGKYGYVNIKHTSAAARRVALRAGVMSEGYATIIRRLNLLANYTKVSDPETYKIMRADIAWIQKNLQAYSLTAARRRGSKRGSRRGSKRGSRRGSKRGSRRGSKVAYMKTGKVVHVNGLTVNVDTLSNVAKKMCDNLDEKIKRLERKGNSVLSKEDLVRMAAMKKKACEKMRKGLKKLSKKLIH